MVITPSPLQRLHGFGYNGIVRIHLSTWLVLKLEGSVHSVPRDVTLPSLDRLSAVTTSSATGLGDSWFIAGTGTIKERQPTQYNGVFGEPKYCNFWEQQLRGIKWIDGSSCGDGYGCRFTG